jgi:hypothetical protein
MENLETLKVIEEFFLRKDSELTRHEYALMQSLNVREMLLEIENLFFTTGLDSDKILDFLERKDLIPVKNNISEIQKNFYLKVYSSAELLENFDDDERLVKAKNPSYEFLKNDERFEQELERALTYERKRRFKSKVSMLEEQRLKDDNELGDGVDAMPIAASHIEKNRPRKSYLLWTSSLAAAVLIIVMLWQPFHESNEELYSAYISKNITIASADLISGESGIRGDTEGLFLGLSEVEKRKASAALKLFQEEQYRKSASILNEINVSDRDSSQLLIFLAISQLKIGDIERARINLKAVSSSKNTVQHDDANFYLALYYLKTNNRQEAKRILLSLVANSKEYEEEAKYILQKLRWF